MGVLMEPQQGMGPPMGIGTTNCSWDHQWGLGQPMGLGPPMGHGTTNGRWELQMVSGIINRICGLPMKPGTTKGTLELTMGSMVTMVHGTINEIYGYNGTKDHQQEMRLPMGMAATVTWGLPMVPGSQNHQWDLLAKTQTIYITFG